MDLVKLLCELSAGTQFPIWDLNTQECSASLSWRLSSDTRYLISNLDHYTEESKISVETTNNLRITVLGKTITDSYYDIIVGVMVRNFFSPIIMKIKDFEYLVSCHEIIKWRPQYYRVKFEIL